MGKLMDDVVYLAKQYVENFKDKGEFDYSMESLAFVDAHMESMRRHGLSPDQLRDLSAMAGSYVFETARCNAGGNYFWDDKGRQPLLVAGIPRFFVSMNAWQKTRGRLERGAEDNIAYFVEGYCRHVAIGKGRAGYIAKLV